MSLLLPSGVKSPGVKFFMVKKTDKIGIRAAQHAARQKFAAAQKLQASFERQLLRISRNVETIIRQGVEAGALKFLAPNTPDSVLVWVDPAKLEPDWQKSHLYHLGNRGTERYENFVRHLDTNPLTPIEAPTASFAGQGGLVIERGEHRLAVLRDHGEPRVAVAVPRDQVKQFQSRYGAEPLAVSPRAGVRVATIIESRLADYAKIIEPWARAASAKLVASIARKDVAAWKHTARAAGITLKREIENSDVGAMMRAQSDLAANLIKSIPLSAAKSVREKTMAAILAGGRAETLEGSIRATKAQARLIARTETARTGALLTRARAGAVGVETYEWVSCGDESVRTRHRKLNGKHFRFDDPPVSGENGERSGPGEIYNCRCVAFPDIG